MQPNGRLQAVLEEVEGLSRPREGRAQSPLIGYTPISRSPTTHKINTVALHSSVIDFFSFSHRSLRYLGEFNSTVREPFSHLGLQLFKPGFHSLTFPYDQHTPTRAGQQVPISSIAFDVLLQFVHPKSLIDSWKPPTAARLVSVPKASLNKYNRLVLSYDYTWFDRNGLQV